MPSAEAQSLLAKNAHFPEAHYLEHYHGELSTMLRQQLELCLATARQLRAVEEALGMQATTSEVVLQPVYDAAHAA